MSTSKVRNQQIEEAVKENRKADYPVDPLFLNRWSPRSYSDRKVSDEDLYTVLEAARWAPSSMNEQPWRFIVANTEEHQKKFESFIMEGNRVWSDQVPILILVASYKHSGSFGGENKAHAFDAGSAWASMAFQAKLIGLSTHAMGGFDKEKAHEVLNVPDDYQLHAVIALGYQDDKGKLPEPLQEREVPSSRKPLTETVYIGSM